METQGKSVFVTVCSRNTGYWHMYLAFQKAAGVLGQTLGIRSVLKPHIGDSLISRARCIMLKDFLETNCDYLFTLDDDIELPEDAMVKLIQADKDIIGGMYRLKKLEVTNNPYALRFKVEDRQINFDDIVEVDYLSTGCMMHKREFIEKLVEQDYKSLWFYENMTGRKIPALYMPFIYKNEYLSEDWAFCQRAKDKGHKIWLHAGVQCGHWGLHNFHPKDLKPEEREIKYD